MVPPKWKRPNLNWRYTIAWVILGLAAVVLEVWAIFDGGRGDTLSEQMWWILGFHPAIWYTGLGVALGGGYWLVKHFWWRER